MCDDSLKEDFKKATQYSVHSPNNIRVIGAIQNSHEFAKAFNCPTGSKMNPSPEMHKKCILD